MAVAPAVLLLDDGELDDIQEMLQQMDVPFARVRGGAIVDGTPPPRDVLIATPRRIGAVADTVAGSLVPPIRMMVVNEDSNALRAQLRGSGFDYLVRRPVHIEALRLMLLHCIYKGEERRREPRVAVGFEVSFRCGLLTRRATLADLSLHGCRLLTQHRVQKGKRIRVDIPEALHAGEPVAISGRVARVEESRRTGTGEFAIGVSFEKLDDTTREVLELLVEDHSHGPATLRTGAAPRPARPTPIEPEERHAEHGRSGAGARSDAHGATAPAPAASRGRRRNPRAAFSSTVPAFTERALRVLVGRDLSVEGMRVMPQPDLAIGDRLHLAIYGEAGADPLLVWGRVDRIDGDEALAIRFEAVGSALQSRLERLVADLPAVESLHDTEAQAMGTVVSEIVD